MYLDRLITRTQGQEHHAACATGVEQNLIGRRRLVNGRQGIASLPHVVSPSPRPSDIRLMPHHRRPGWELGNTQYVRAIITCFVWTAPDCRTGREKATDSSTIPQQVE